ncbi:MAG: hypothetical protein ACJAYF_002721 [Arenicella sp.]
MKIKLISYTELIVVASINDRDPELHENITFMWTIGDFQNSVFTQPDFATAESGSIN